MIEQPPSRAANVRRGDLIHAGLTCGPGLAWLLVFLLLPLLLLLGMSFLSRGQYGGVEWPLTLESYRRLAGFGAFGFDPVYPIIFARTLALAAATTGLCLLAAFPLALWLSLLPRRWKNAALLLVVIPFWTNLLIRTYAWQVLLGPGSFVAKMCVALGMIPEGAALFPGNLAVLACMVCDFLPFMVLPLYASLERLDWSVAEAAMDLGANRWNVLRHAILPQARPGMLAGSLLVFLPACGQFVIPDLLGGAKTALLGNVLQQQFGSSRDWPFGAAIASASLVLVIAGLWGWRRWSASRDIHLA